MRLSSLLFLLPLLYIQFHLATGEVLPQVHEMKEFDQLHQIKVEVPYQVQDQRQHVYLVLNGPASLLAKSESEVSNGNVVCAHAEFSNTLSSSGWDTINVETTGNCGRLGSMYAVGWVEGFLTSELVAEYLNDLIVGKANANNNYLQVRTTFEKVYYNTLENMRVPKITLNQEEAPFWSGIELFAAQFEGMTAGVRARKGQERIGLGDMLFVNSNGEIDEVVNVLQNYIKFDEPKIFLQEGLKYSKKGFRAPEKVESKSKENQYKGMTKEEAHDLWVKKLLKSHCSAIVKLLRDDQGLIKDVMTAHGTWDSYAGMLKIMKKYHFVVSQIEGQATQDYKILFPSYPGCLTSQDDFYVRANGLILTETTLNLFDDHLYKENIESSIYMPTFLKIAAANFVGNTAENWIRYFSYINTGTYNSQWMILNVENLEKSIHQKELLPHTFYVLEQIPGTMISQDMSEHLNDKAYWASFNLPAFDETYFKSGSRAIHDQTGAPDYSRTENPRAILFKNLQESVTNIEDLKALIRLNKVDKGSYLWSSQNSQSNQIAPRFDLSLNEASKTLSGETDAKITNLDLAKQIGLVAISGPTIANSKPFSFPDDVYRNLVGLPQTWDFNWEKYSF